MMDQLIARPLPTHGPTQTQNTSTETPAHLSKGIQTHDPSVRAGEESSLEPSV
jgi:hypothetical protein